MAVDRDEVFLGFWHPSEKQGYTQLPHELIERMDMMSDAELRVVLYIFRHTWGFHEYDETKRLTTEEIMKGRRYKERDENGEVRRMDHGTGLSDRGAKNGIADAIKHGYIICEIDDSDKARIKKSYGVKIYEEK